MTKYVQQLKYVWRHLSLTFNRLSLPSLAALKTTFLNSMTLVSTLVLSLTGPGLSLSALKTSSSYHGDTITVTNTINSLAVFCYLWKSLGGCLGDVFLLETPAAVTSSTTLSAAAAVVTLNNTSRCCSSLCWQSGQYSAPATPGQCSSTNWRILLHKATVQLRSLKPSLDCVGVVGSATFLGCCLNHDLLKIARSFTQFYWSWQ